jgi:hypothetical protein
MPIASLVRFSATPIGRKFVLQQGRQHLGQPPKLARRKRNWQRSPAAAPRCDKPALAMTWHQFWGEVVSIDRYNRLILEQGVRSTHLTGRGNARARRRLRAPQLGNGLTAFVSCAVSSAESYCLTR